MTADEHDSRKGRFPSFHPHPPRGFHGHSLWKERRGILTYPTQGHAKVHFPMGKKSCPGVPESSWSDII